MRKFAGTLLMASAMVFAPAVGRADDSEVATRIAASLQASSKLQDFTVGVKVVDRTAILAGRVANRKQKQVAEAIARRHPRVSRVVNRIVVGGNASSLGNRRAGSGIQSVGHYVEQDARQLIDRLPNAPSSYRVQPVANQVTTGPTPAVSQGGGTAVSVSTGAGGVGPISYDHPHMPNYAWPSYATYPNYAGVSYPKQYSAMAWPYIGPFYPYPQVPLGWRSVSLEWDDGWWMLDFKDRARH